MQPLPIDKRLSQISKRRASTAEVDQVVQTCKSGFAGWNVAHFHSKYRAEFKGTRSYSSVKTVLQGAGQVRRAKSRGKHRIKRERAPLPGMMVHQDASTHRSVPSQALWDLVVTMDDATGEHTSLFLCDQEGTASSFHGIGQTVARYGMFCSLYTDRGSHYFHTPQAAGKVDKLNLTEVGRALKQLGIGHIAAYSPEARAGRVRPQRQVNGATEGGAQVGRLRADANHASGLQSHCGLRPPQLCGPLDQINSKRTIYLLPNRTVLFAADTEEPLAVPLAWRTAASRPCPAARADQAVPSGGRPCGAGVAVESIERNDVSASASAETSSPQ